MKIQTQSGNALFFILVAVVMLGLLTMILSRGGSNTEQTGDFEQNRIQIGQLLRYAKSIETSIQEMKLLDISENDISFENPTTATDYTNANCDAAGDRSFPSCLLFDAQGAGLTYRNFANMNDGSDWIITGANNVGTTAGPVGSTAARIGNDLIMLLPNMDQTLCIQINRDLDVGTAGTLPVETTGIATTAFTGTFATGGPTLLDGDPTPFELNSETAGCFTDTAPDPDVTYFYYVVLAR